MDSIDRLKQVTNSLKLCTEPINGHPDPNSIDDCWNEVSDYLDRAENDFKVCLSMLESILQTPYLGDEDADYDRSEQIHAFINEHKERPKKEPLKYSDGTEIDDLPF